MIGSMFRKRNLEKRQIITTDKWSSVMLMFICYCFVYVYAFDDNILQQRYFRNVNVSTEIINVISA
jgi:hypothetical protein